MQQMFDNNTWYMHRYKCISIPINFPQINLQLNFSCRTPTISFKISITLSQGNSKPRWNWCQWLAGWHLGVISPWRLKVVVHAKCKWHEDQEIFNPQSIWDELLSRITDPLLFVDPSVALRCWRLNYLYTSLISIVTCRQRSFSLRVDQLPLW